MSELTVSHSRVDSYLRCRRQEYYGYALKLRKVAAAPALRLGSAGHHLLDVLYSAVKAGGGTAAKQKAAYPGAVKAMWDELDKMYTEGFQDIDNRATLREILENYLKREPFIDRGWSDDKRVRTILAVEKEFRLVWDDETGASYPFIVDLIIRDPSGRMIVVDNKFVYDFYSIEAAQLMPQLPKYIGALRGLGYKVANEGIYNMIRTRPNSKGDKLKKAEMVDALLDNFAKLQRPAELLVLEQELPKMLVKDLEATMEAEGLPYFTGRPVNEWSDQLVMPISATRVERSFLEQVIASEEVNELDTLDPEERDLKALRCGNTKTCDFCDFRPLCSAELRGDNIEIMMRTEYEIKPKRDEIEISVDYAA